jgi:hypothetical protein
MTSEVVIMNKRAIALAADSAVTITTTDSLGNKEKKYFKGVNKVFELSHHNPVGIMIFSMADIHSVPWEIIIKLYRDHLGKNSLNSLDEYARDLFSFIENRDDIFPQERNKDILVNGFISAAVDASKFINTASTEISAPETAHIEALADLKSRLSDMAMPSHFNANAIEEALTLAGEDIIQISQVILEKQSIEVDVNEFARVAIELYFKNYQNILGHTGIVIAGYGSGDIFPSFVQYDCYGIILGNLIVDKKKEKHVSYDNGSHIDTFAMDDMVQTFMLGVSPGVLNIFGECIEDCINQLIGESSPESTLENEQRKEQILDTARRKIIDSQAEYHYKPLTRAISSLPTDEMANLAETLIMLESLKERVTRPSESVGGPVDVAVITKSEGLVWIKRKHYFEASLNPKFIAKQHKRID